MSDIKYIPVSLETMVTEYFKRKFKKDLELYDWFVDVSKGKVIYEYIAPEGVKSGTR